MKRNKIFIFCLLLATTLTATASYGQSPNPISSQPSPSSPNPISNQPSPSKLTSNNVLKDARGNVIGYIKESGLVDAKGNRTGIVIRDTEGNIIGSVVREANANVVRDASGNILYGETIPTGLSKALNTNNLLDLELWSALLLTIIFGGIGGFIFELINLQGNYEKKHDPTEDELAAKFAYANPQNVVDLGFFARVIIGAAAAPAAMVLLEPLIVGSAFKLLAMSVVAGSAGTAVFRAIQDRLLVGIAQKERDEAKVENQALEFKQNASLIESKLEQANAAYKELYKKIAEGGKLNPKNPSKLIFPTPVSLLPEDFSNVWVPLNEAKAMSAPVQDAIKEFAALKTTVYNLASANRGDPTPVLTLKTAADKDSLDIESLDRVQKLLNEAGGKVQATIAR